MGKDDTEVVTARPFIHQVGGRAVMLEISPGTICKLYNDREFQFYENIPEYLKEFTPHYKGLVSVKCNYDDATPTFRAEVPGYILRNSRGDPSCQHESRAKLKEVKTGLANWSMLCIKRDIKSRGVWSDHDYIMLENLVGSLRMPCILDLKIGTKQTGDDTSEEDKKLREHRSANSTSGTLGIRLSGMHMYQMESDNYLSHNKHYGWTLDEAGLRQVLRQFFYNCCITNVRREVTRIISKLHRLHSILSTQDLHYFFGSSLLLFYDGYKNNRPCDGQLNDANAFSAANTDQSAEDLNEYSSCDQKGDRREERSCVKEHCRTECSCETGKADIRLIDFGRTVLKSDMKERSYGVEFEEGVLFGLANLINILQSIIDS
ncbi:inositol hexakisphosphate kinase 3-like [Pecten maximus]|uniref:inositol hexakisphosphate kinase 3-like n=1 Tax=Pecten maximus TaxID=6579 RepID=UPI0014588448|nr:inositol hexakisphosphate kinase 3-like [Pecten maximus]XP_033763022.1 inositol hexakisphosphate kinase 3-like [Pecten maximus]XP_033763023.1 inositol hexakisphosphate kinase 3-like [Pecten maximus]